MRAVFVFFHGNSNRRSTFKNQIKLLFMEITDLNEFAHFYISRFAFLTLLFDVKNKSKIDLIYLELIHGQPLSNRFRIFGPYNDIINSVIWVMLLTLNLLRALRIYWALSSGTCP